MKKYAVYQIFLGVNTPLSFPYPPLVREEAADYLLFTERRDVSSSFWKVLYQEKWSDEEIQARLSLYEACVKVEEDEIICGHLLGTGEADAGRRSSGTGEADAGGRSTEAGGGEWPAKMRVPSLYETPEIDFDPEKIVPTKKNGKYDFRPNPVFTGGKYEGRPLLLTIGVPVSNQIETIDRCLSHVKPLLDKLDSELVAIDTGSTDGTIEVCAKYGARIYSFPWRDDMSAARNEAIRHARGLWYLSIDDDEWFEDLEGILSFFQSGCYRSCSYATYIQRNYHYQSGEAYTDNHTARLAKITPSLHFEGRIHDALEGIEPGASSAQLTSYAHHYGFTHDDAQAGKNKYLRNTSVLLQDVYEYPESLRYNRQLANEFLNAKYYPQARAYYLRGIAIEKELKDEYYGRIQAAALISAYHMPQSELLFPALGLVRDFYPYTAAERAFFAYCAMDMALLYGHPYGEIAGYYQEYCKNLLSYQKDPMPSNRLTSMGLHVCTNDGYIANAHVMGFCAYAGLGRTGEALDSLSKCEIDSIYYKQEYLLRHAFRASQEIYEAVLARLSPAWCGFYADLMLEAAWKEWALPDASEGEGEPGSDASAGPGCEPGSDASAEPGRKPGSEPPQRLALLLARLPLLLGRLNVEGIFGSLSRKGKAFAEEMPDELVRILIDLTPDGLSVQELCFYAELLKHKIGKAQEDMPVFIAYVQFCGAFAEAYYHPALLAADNAEASPIPADILACHALYEGMLQIDDRRQFVINLRRALAIFPGFKTQIQYLLELV